MIWSIVFGGLGSLLTLIFGGGFGVLLPLIFGIVF